MRYIYCRWSSILLLTFAMGGITLWPFMATALVALEQPVIYVQATGMAADVEVSVTNERVEVTRKEFSKVQCSATYELSATEQQELAQAVATLPHNALAELERPACAACADGDFDTTLHVTHEDTVYTSSSFDLNDPPAELKPIMGMVGNWAISVCPNVSWRAATTTAPQQPEPEPQSDPSPETRSIQQQIIALLQQVIQLLQIR